MAKTKTEKRWIALRKIDNSIVRDSFGQSLMWSTRVDARFKLSHFPKGRHRFVRVTLTYSVPNE